MSISTELTRLQTAKTNLMVWLINHGVLVPINTPLERLVTLLDSVTVGAGTTATVKISNSTTATVTVYGPSGMVTVRANANTSVQTPIGGILAVVATSKNVQPVHGTKVAYTTTESYIRVDSEDCAVYISTLAVV